MKINTNRLMVACLAAFVVVSVIDFVVHTRLLKDMYMATASIWRPEAEFKQIMGWMHVGTAIVAIMFTFIYSQGYEPKKAGVEQGLRYGLYMGVLLGAAGSFMWYVVLPIPGMLAFYWFVSTLVDWLAAGAVIGFVYKS